MITLKIKKSDGTVVNTKQAYDKVELNRYRQELRNSLSRWQRTFPNEVLTIAEEGEL